MELMGGRLLNQNSKVKNDGIESDRTIEDNTVEQQKDNREKQPEVLEEENTQA